ncbi:MAG: hypothetical protein U5L95_04335 [Candidatus Saccharibacteria bacterium]|nr:hypothetical protein [Candidatus Saccharibacteria bacterium]
MNRENIKKIIAALLIGFVVGVLWFVGVRFALYEKDGVHYHGNFAVYINGEREQFDSFAYYEEVQSCGADAAFNPRNRTHMHDETNHVVHVHDEAATWGHFFANLGYTLGNDVLRTDGQMLIDGQGGELSFVLNGEEVDTIANQTIRDEDALLINYGDDSTETLQERYDGLTKDAAEYNERADPSACTAGEPATWQERLKAATGF